MQILSRSIYKFSISKFNPSKDYYKVLGISTSADQKQIKKAFRDSAKRFHPDSATGNQDKFKEVNQAYQVLSEAAVKKQYDQIRSYGSSASSSSSNYSNPGYGQQQPGGSYQNYANGQYQYNQSGHPNYQHPSQKNNYRGYTRADGWQNQKYRQQVMNQIFKQYQRQTYAKSQQNRSHQGSFQEMYRNNQQNIRQYPQQLKRRQDSIRKAYQAQQIKKQRQFREYQQRQIKDLEEQLKKKANDFKDGIVKNVHGFIRVGEFLKETWKNVAKSVSDLADKNEKNNKNKKK